VATILEASLSTEVGQYAPWISLITMLAGLYLMFVKKDRTFIETITSMKMLIPVSVFLGVALAPATALAVFGGFAGAISIILGVITAAVVPLIILAALAWLIQLFYPRILE